MSARHWLATGAAPINTTWHGRVRSARCELRQDLMAPPPGATSPHAALISSAHSLITRCCAVAYVVESNTTVAIAAMAFIIGSSRRLTDYVPPKASPRNQNNTPQACIDLAQVVRNY